MNDEFDATLLKVYISSTDKFRHTALYEMIVYAAKRYGMAGATVHKGIMGFGASSAISSAKFWELTEKLPVIVEIVDEKEKIKWFFDLIRPFFEKIRSGCVVTMEDTRVVLFKSGNKK